MHYPSVGGHGCQTKVCGVVRAQELQNSHRLRGRRSQTAVEPPLGHMDRLSTSDRMPLPPKTEAGSWTATLGRQWCRVGGCGLQRHFADPLRRKELGRNLECLNPHWRPERRPLVLRMAELDQSPRASSPLQARLPHASLACPPSSPSLPHRLFFPFQAGYLAVPRQLLSLCPLGWAVHLYQEQGACVIHLS